MKIEEQPTLDKVFILAIPEHLLHKLHWEIKKLQQAQANDAPAPTDFIADAYYAFNCAVTAWHMADWIWMALEDGDKPGLFSDGYPGRLTLTNFQKEIRSQSQAVRLCQQLANSAKHMVITKHADPAVKTAATWGKKPAKYGEAMYGDPYVTYRSHFVVKDGTDEIEAVDLFIEAFEFWRRFMEQRGLAKPSASPHWGR